MRKNKFKAKHIAISALLTSLICVILSLGVIFETLDLSFAAISALLIWITLLEFGKGTAWGVYVPASVISILLLPSKIPALFFTCVTGWYPMFKFFIEKKIKNPLLLWSVKLLLFNCVSAALILFVVFFGAGLGISFDEEVTEIYIIVMMALCNLAFIVTDILMNKLVIVYIVKIRDKLIKMKIIDNKEHRK